ncbi:TRAP transporter small permease [Halotia wernerae UHCC 0503]|jgi:TRAP-type C4-dicarboxylate transport system permease small subunit|nr:TRAP transporter small permease [Halotia wernerae UHCC 0503]
MRPLARLHTLLLDTLVLIGALAIVAMMLHVIVDVILRNVSNTPIPATYEIVTKYYMIALAFVPLAFVERRGGMVQVEVIDPFLSARLRDALERLVAALSAIVYATLAWVTLESAFDAFATGAFVMAQTYRLPVWPGFFLPPLGFALATVAVIIRVVQPGESEAS